MPVGESAENLRKLALAYVQFAAQHRGEWPADEDSLKPFKSGRNEIDEQDAAPRIISPRDNEP